MLDDDFDVNHCFQCHINLIGLSCWKIFDVAYNGIVLFLLSSFTSNHSPIIPLQSMFDKVVKQEFTP